MHFFLLEHKWPGPDEQRAASQNKQNKVILEGPKKIPGAAQPGDWTIEKAGKISGL